MEKLFEILRAPGAQSETSCAAPTQVIINKDVGEKKGSDVFAENVDTYAAMPKAWILDRWFDKVVQISGSEFTYFTIVISLLAWALLGIPFGQSNVWQISISDAQAVINMVFDAFLMRQQLNSHSSLLLVTARLRSRSSSHKRMLKQLIQSGSCHKIDPAEFQKLQQTDFVGQLPVENWLGRISTAFSAFMGNTATILGFWVCIFIWIGLGKYCNWTSTWELYINSATSALMVFMFAFLANIRERHARYMTECLKAIWAVDAALEVRLRMATGDEAENPTVVIPARTQSRIQRRIDYYADLVGTLAGIAILIIVIIVWVTIGPTMHFGATWWLLIGTYAGLVGLNDGFVLRNVCKVLGDYEDAQFDQVRYDDMDMLAVIGVENITEESFADDSLSCRISIRMGDICSHELTVVFGVLLTVGLVTGASVMGWNVTGQLLCNVPPGIIESFFTMILITGHNMGEAKRRIDFSNLYLRRLRLISYVDLTNKADRAIEICD